ncbi:MAG: BlaI/MecI/CopY family transcriptional regulator [Pirellulales bacterium]|nr:BlaI/MecI/CopY family transcriptional regulator [Pirellulales bacterium]
MPRHPSAQPTKVELEILHLLWEHGPCPLGEVHGAVSAHSDRSYSTTRKMIQVMRDKGLVVCDESARPQLYAAAKTKKQTQLNLLEDLAQRAFGGSTKKLVMSLLSAERVTFDDVREMQQLVEKAKGCKK